ncbi:MAG: hypothetical protein ACRDXB_02145, partial [Actinomycetes bacterium]
MGLNTGAVKALQHRAVARLSLLRAGAEEPTGRDTAIARGAPSEATRRLWLTRASDWLRNSRPPHDAEFPHLTHAPPGVEPPPIEVRIVPGRAPDGLVAFFDKPDAKAPGAMLVFEDVAASIDAHLAAGRLEPTFWARLARLGPSLHAADVQPMAASEQLTHELDQAELDQRVLLDAWARELAGAPRLPSEVESVANELVRLRNQAAELLADPSNPHRIVLLPLGAEPRSPTVGVLRMHADDARQALFALAATVIAPVAEFTAARSPTSTSPMTPRNEGKRHLGVGLAAAIPAGPAATTPSPALDPAPGTTPEDLPWAPLGEPPARAPPEYLTDLDTVLVIGVAGAITVASLLAYQIWRRGPPGASGRATASRWWNTRPGRVVAGVLFGGVLTAALSGSALGTADAPRPATSVMPVSATTTEPASATRMFTEAEPARLWILRGDTASELAHALGVRISDFGLANPHRIIAGDPL